MGGGGGGQTPGIRQLFQVLHGSSSRGHTASSSLVVPWPLCLVHGPYAPRGARVRSLLEGGRVWNEG